MRVFEHVLPIGADDGGVAEFGNVENLQADVVVASGVGILVEHLRLLVRYSDGWGLGAWGREHRARCMGA